MNNAYRLMMLAVCLVLLLIPVACNPAPTPTAPALPSATVFAAPTMPVPPTATAFATLKPNPTALPVPSPSRVGSATARLNEPFTIGMSQWVTLSDSGNTRIIFTNILEDSCCPSTASCMQPGRARVRVSLESGNRLAVFDLSSFGMDLNSYAAFNGYIVELREVAPVAVRVGDTIPPSNYRVTLLVKSGTLDLSTAHFDEPFTLKLGQSIGFEGSNMRLTFESVQQDSRCPTRGLCATSGTATLIVAAAFIGASEKLTVQVGGNEVMTSYPAVHTASVRIRANALTPYPQQDFASKEIAPNEYQATFVVVNPAAPIVVPTPR